MSMFTGSNPLHNFMVYSTRDFSASLVQLSIGNLNKKKIMLDKIICVMYMLLGHVLKTLVNVCNR